MSNPLPNADDAGHNGDEYTPCNCDACKAGDADLADWASWEAWRKLYPDASDEDYWQAKYPDAE